MKKLLLPAFLNLFALTCLNASDQPPVSLSGTYLVGSSQPVYKKLTDVANALNNAANTVTGHLVFELDSDYDGTVGETFPITFNQFTATGGDWMVTIRPKAGVSERMTTGNAGAGNALIILDGTDRLVLDGRPGGTGESIGWLIRNADAGTTAGPVLLLQNDAMYNTMTWLQLEGQTAVNGIISLGGTTGSEGNDNNTISYCIIRDRTDVTGRPATGIAFYGTQTDISAFNSGNVITNNALINIYNASGAGYGIDLANATTATTVTYNNFYQTSLIEANSTTSSVCGIAVREPAASDMEISYNFVGGSAPGCGAQPYTLTATGTNYVQFTGILLEASGGAGTGNKIRYNTVRNLVIAAGRVPGYNYTIFTGIRVNGTNAAEATGNIIGHNEGHDDIVLSTEGTQGLSVHGLYYGYQSGGSVTANKVGGITIDGTANSALSFLYGIQLRKISTNEPAEFNVTGNLVGSTTTTGNIRALAPDIPMYFYGIYSNLTSPVTQNIKNDTVAGISMGFNGTSPTVLINALWLSENAITVVDHNLISDMSSASRNASDYYTFAGIYCSGLSSPVISNNTVRHMHLTATGPMGLSNPYAQTTYVLGVQVTGHGEARVYNNHFYDFTSANEFSSGATTLFALDIKMKSVIYNNVVSLTNGNYTNNCELRGIRVLSVPDSVQIYHNTIHLGGNNGESAHNAISYAIGRQSGTASLDIRNNLLVNARTGGGAHYLFVNRTAADWPATASDNNVLISANLARMALWGTGSVLDTAQWKTTGGDVNSSIYSVTDLDPAGLFTDIAAGELSIKESAREYVAGKGASGTGITTDYTGKRRSATVPSAGAYEYPAAGVENSAPVITSHNGELVVNLQLPENTTAVTTVTATDAEGDVLVYSLSGEDADKFSIDPATGELRFITAPDFEQPGDANGDNAYIVLVEVSDGDSTAYQRFKLKITDANDHAPVIISYNGEPSVTVRMEENTTAAVGTVTATDVDRNAVITYSLVDEEDAGKFSVHAATGELTFITPPDFDQPGDVGGDNVYIVTVKASDGDSSAYQRFKVKITDVNDNAPVFTSHNGEAVVNLELAENTQLVSTVSAIDGDHTPVTYGIENEDDGALFSVSPSGELIFIMAPDFEHPADGNRDNIYKVTVKASDGSLWAVQQFIITVTDVNDNPPVVTMTVRVPENTVEVTPLEGTDDDAGSSPVLFTLMDKEDGGLFWLNPSTGSLEFKTAPDFEQPHDSDHDNTYIVSVQMTAGEIITILRFKVKVTAADGGAGRMSNRSMPEPQVQSTVVLQMEAAPEPGKAIKVYPNPVTGKRFTLRMDSIATGQYTLELYTTAGQLACRQQISHTGKSALYPVQLPGNLTRGTYVLKLRGANLGHTEKLIVE